MDHTSLMSIRKEDLDSQTESIIPDTGNGILPPAAITSIVVVFAIVIMILLIRAMLCIKKREGCRHACFCDRAVSEVGTISDLELPDSILQCPPGYLECVNNPVYRIPDRKLEAGNSIDGFRPPPAYDLIEKGHYETLDVADKFALERLRHSIMSKSNDSLSTLVAVEVTVQAEVHIPPPDGVDNYGFSGYQDHIAGSSDARNAEDLQTKERTIVLSRVPSSISTSSSLPKYGDLHHPPGYDNLCISDNKFNIISETMTSGVVQVRHNQPEKSFVSQGVQTDHTYSDTISSILSTNEGDIQSSSGVVTEPETIPGIAIAQVHMNNSMDQLHRYESERLHQKIQKNDTGKYLVRMQSLGGGETSHNAINRCRSNSVPTRQNLANSNSNTNKAQTGLKSTVEPSVSSTVRTLPRLACRQHLASVIGDGQGTSISDVTGQDGICLTGADNNLSQILATTEGVIARCYVTQTTTESTDSTV